LTIVNCRLTVVDQSRRYESPIEADPVIPRCFENPCAEGTLECGSASYRRLLAFNGGSPAAALHDELRIFMVSGCPSADGHERLLS